MPVDQRYRAAPASALARVELDALTAVYDRRSGQTHLLASPLPELLDALGDRAWRLVDLAGELATRFELASEDGDMVAALTARFDELGALGLVEIG